MNVYAATSPAIEKEMVQSLTHADDQNGSNKSSSQNEYSENVVASDSIQDSMDSIVLIESCTGSMDSINSFSQIPLSNSINTIGLLINTTEATEVTNASNETHVQNDLNINTNKKCDYRTTANRQSDSTDEDSGIENIIRVTKEI